MNPFEAADLLAYAAAFDNRHPSIAANEAWAKALADIPLDQDVYDAINAYYSEPTEPGQRHWLMPFHVRHYRKIARDQRIDAANVIYDGNPDETGLESAHGLRALIRAAGDGQLGDRPVLQAIPDRRPTELEAGRTSRLQEALAAIGTMPPRIVPGVTNPLAVACPHCAAVAGRPCRTKLSKRAMADPHPARTDRAQRAAAGLDEDEAS
ncbi:zinc finger domain-containing protein [Kitasatospora kifunensis]|uniref:DNA-binding phage zinc finger domain-containing protein n=1 Tax=Kitasatospora kifunensis TaxID=58351 RepID=A0A7W7VU01_KITKI|nr:hypothetical protein [Kitasatospora kifunensis]MBB4922154.1 hypothetical protein [Kitasatospora kifunensis]